jgi:hypothetical protein
MQAFLFCSLTKATTTGSFNQNAITGIHFYSCQTRQFNFLAIASDKMLFTALA